MSHNFHATIFNDKRAECVLYTNDDDPSFNMTFSSIEDIENLHKNLGEAIVEAKQRRIWYLEQKARFEVITSGLD
jgi:hypothetical protein